MIVKKKIENHMNFHFIFLIYFFRPIFYKPITESNFFFFNKNHLHTIIKPRNIPRHISKPVKYPKYIKHRRNPPPRLLRDETCRLLRPFLRLRVKKILEFSEASRANWKINYVGTSVNFHISVKKARFSCI